MLKRLRAKARIESLAAEKSPLRSWILAALLLGGPLLLVTIYYSRAFFGLDHPEAMELAQLGRNLISGLGYSTYVLRPLALDAAHPLRQPDMTNGPLYPFLLALAFGTFGAKDGVAAGVSALFYILTVPALFLLGTHLFHRGVGRISALIFAFTAPFLQYAVSGRHITLCIFLFTALLLVYFQIAAYWRDLSTQGERVPKGKVMLAGALTGLLYLADPAYFWAIPVLAGMVVWISPARKLTAAWFFIPLLVLTLPWMLRNLTTSGSPFLGLHGAELWMDTDLYPGVSGYRLTEKDIIPGGRIFFSVVKKAFVNLGRAINGLPGLGPAWVMAFFLPSLFFSFRDPAAGMLRKTVIYTTLAILLGQIFFTLDMARFAVVAPAVLVFAVAYFLHLLQQGKMPVTQQRWVGALLAFTVLFPLLSARNPRDKNEFLNEAAVAAHLSELSRKDQVVLSDQPWMVAWYANRPSLWIPKEVNRVKEVRDRVKGANWLYLTQDIRKDSYQWQSIFDVFQQWNLMNLQAQANRHTPPRPMRITRNGTPLFNALDGFVSAKAGVHSTPLAVIGYLPEGRPVSNTPQ